IILMGGRLPVILHEYFFDNEEGGVEGKEINRRWQTKNRKPIKQAIKDSMFDLMNEGHKIILIYPIPEVGWNVPSQLFKELPKKNVVDMKDWINKKGITTSYEVYKKRTQSSFELLDSIKHPNLYRVYPHKLFCDNQIKGRCITHDDENIFYADDDHPSNEGAKLINNLIVNQLKLIETGK
ncbi:SGNH hydrolase domain-containing protein, partial [Methylophilaceae bacterium]|nr:SGNH hydrolase domain-containing protein [Methylophilaceae bacterium]